MALLFQWLNNSTLGNYFYLKRRKQILWVLGRRRETLGKDFGSWGSQTRPQETLLTCSCVSTDPFWRAKLDLTTPCSFQAGFVCNFFFFIISLQEAAVQRPQSTHWRPNKIRNTTNPSALPWKRWQVSIARTQNPAPFLAVQLMGIIIPVVFLSLQSFLTVWSCVGSDKHCLWNLRTNPGCSSIQWVLQGAFASIHFWDLLGINLLIKELLPGVHLHFLRV